MKDLYPLVHPQPVKRCANKACRQINPLPETKQYFYYHSVKQRFDNFCIKCRTTQKRVQRGHSRSSYTWAKAFLRGLKSDKHYDPRMTLEVITVLMDLQKSKCALTGMPFLLPTQQDLVTNRRYKGWLSSLTFLNQLRTPRLISTIYGKPLVPGNCLFICNYLYDLYRYHGSVTDMLTFNKLKTPIIYQATAIYKEIK